MMAMAIERVSNKKGLFQLLAVLVATGLLFVLTTCGGGGGSSPPPDQNVTITGVVDGGAANSPIPSPRCRFVGTDDQMHDAEVGEQDGSYQLIVPPGVQGYIYCSPQSMASLKLTTFSSTAGIAAGETLTNEHINPTTTVAADIIRYEEPADPLSRKLELLLDIQTGQDPNLELVATMAGRLYRAMLAQQVNTSFGNDGGDPDPGGGGDDAGVGGEAGDGADFSPLPGAECAFVVGADFESAQSIPSAALADFLADGELNRLDLKDLDVEPPEGVSHAEVQQAFSAWFGLNGLGEELTTTTDAEGNYFLPIPANLAGFVRCTPRDRQRLVLGTYIPGRASDEVRSDEHVTPATTVFSTLIAPQLEGDLTTIKENFIADIGGLETQLVQEDGSLTGFQLREGTAPADDEVGLVAFSATALFNLFYKNDLDVDFPVAIADLADQQTVDPAFLVALGVPSAQTQSLADIVNQSIDTTAGRLDTDLAAALSTARLRVTVKNAADDGPVPGAVIDIENDLPCEGCGQATDANGQLILTLSEVPEAATQIGVTASSGSGDETTRATVNVVAFATVDLEVLLGRVTPTFNLVLQGGGEGGGSVTSRPAGIDCTINGNAEGACSQAYASGTQVTLSAAPADGSTFGGWTDACTGADATCTVSMDADAIVTALFTQQCAESDYTVNLSTTAFGPGGGEGSITVTAPAGCPWRATANVNWISIAPASGSGNGSARFTVSTNSTASARNGVITVAGRSFTVIQAPIPPCTVSLAPEDREFPYTGGTGSISVTAPESCEWRVSASEGWLNITAGGSGLGNGTVRYEVLANSGDSRSGAILVADQIHTVTQGPAPCTHTISPASRSFTTSGGTGSITVTPSYAGCTTPWTATESVGWISITSGSSGSGAGSVGYTVSANSGASRSATITVAGRSHTVSQGAGSCTYTISPTSRSFTSTGGTGSITVTPSYAGCTTPWTATESVGWISITSGGSGSGAGSVGYTVSSNSGASRSATITVAGRSHTVSQGAGSCTYTITPTIRSFTATGGTGSITVTPSYAGCTTPWTATESVGWISITSGGSGSGAGSVGYTVSSNSGASRSATITVAARSHSVTQDPAPLPPPAPTLISPSNNAVLDNGCDPDPNQLRWDFDWTDVSSATSYELEADHPDPGQGGTVTIYESSYAMIGNSPLPNSYLNDWRWHVRACNDIGCGSWSAWRYFSVELVNTDCPLPGPPEISSIRDDYQGYSTTCVNGSGGTFSGYLSFVYFNYSDPDGNAGESDGAYVTVNGVRWDWADIGGNGFSGTVDFSYCSTSAGNNLDVIMFDGEGNASNELSINLDGP